MNKLVTNIQKMISPPADYNDVQSSTKRVDALHNCVLDVFKVIFESNSLILFKHKKLRAASS